MVNLSTIYTFDLLKISFDSEISVSNFKIINSNTKFVCKFFSRVKEF